MMDAWWIWFILFLAAGWVLRGLGKDNASTIELRDSVRQLARLTFDMDKRLRQLEKREPSVEVSEDEFFRRLGL